MLAESQVLHPESPNDMSESIIEGPESDIPQARADLPAD